MRGPQDGGFDSGKRGLEGPETVRGGERGGVSEDGAVIT